MPVLMVSVNYLCPIMSLMSLCQKTCSCCFKHFRAHQSGLTRFNNGGKLSGLFFMRTCGITQGKWLARGYIWWPGVDRALKIAVQTCAECQKNQKSPARALMHPWEWPDCPWTRIHVNYTGLVKGKKILVVTDSHWKWIEAPVFNLATS